MKNVLVFSVIVLILRVSVWAVPFVRDAYGYAYCGQGIARGLVLYKEVWDHKPPGIHFLDAVISSISPDYILGLRIASMLSSLVAVLIFYQLLRHFYSNKTSFVSSILFAFFTNVYMVTQGDNMIETYMLSLLTLCYYFFVLAEKKKNVLFYFFCGVALGLLFLFKQVGILPLGAIVIYKLIKREQFFTSAVAIAFGLITPLIPTVFYFWVNNAVKDAWEAIFLYNFFYAGEGYSISSLGQSFFYILQVVLGTFLFWYFAIYGLIEKKWKKEDILFFLFVLFAFLGTALGGKFAFTRNYFLLMLPALGYFVAKGVESLQIGSMNNTQKKTFYLTGIFLLIPSLIFQGQVVLSGLYFQKIFDPGEREVKYTIGLTNYNFVEDAKIFDSIASYLKSHTTKGDYILDWGAEPEVYLLPKVYSPTRYWYNFPINGAFIKSNFLLHSQRKDFIREIQTNKPMYIIANKSEQRYQNAFDELKFPEFEVYITKNYILETTIDNYLLFKIKNNYNQSY